jgi:phosphopantothenoylcysteine decarboxylase/phosphopantothenate--cysteine ligase
MNRPTGRRMLITAGPTHEYIDDVRYISNRSSGRMGIALARAGVRRGYVVTLLMGPSEVEPPPEARALRFVSTAELEALLEEHFPSCDLLVMAAAVADYRPSQRIPGKLRRADVRLTLDLEPTPDLIARCAAHKSPHQRIIGFALEEERELQASAVAKLSRKGLDAIVANPIEVIGSSQSTATIHLRDGTILPSPRLFGEATGSARFTSKDVMADWIISVAESLPASGRAPLE